MAVIISSEEMVKIKAFKTVPVQGWTGSGGSRRLSSQISRQSIHEDSKVVSPKHRSPLPPRRYFRYSFLLEVESTPGQKGYVKEKFQ